MLLREAIEAFLDLHFAAGQRADGTRRAYTVDLTQFRAFAGASRHLEDIDAELVEEWIARLHGAFYAPASIQRKLSSLRAFLSHCERRRAIRRSPMASIRYRPRKMPHPPRTLARADMWRLLAYARSLVPLDYATASACSRRGFVALRDLALLDLFLSTGLRVGEVSALNIQDYSRDDHVVRVRGKGGRERLAFVVVPYSRGIQERYLELLRQVRPATPALFPNSRSQRFSARGIRRMVGRKAREAGIRAHLSPHMLRNTAATLLLRNGVDLRIVQEFLGHASITTTQRYTHVSRADLLSALRSRHPLLETWSGAAPLRFGRWDSEGEEAGLLVSQLA